LEPATQNTDGLKNLANQVSDACIQVLTQDFRLPSFPRQRESNNPLQRLDTRFHGYDDKRFISESPVTCCKQGEGVFARLRKLFSPLPAMRSARSFQCRSER
jgi:hypothetical protein